jgi:hypothetical protein
MPSALFALVIFKIEFCFFPRVQDGLDLHHPILCFLLLIGGQVHATVPSYRLKVCVCGSHDLLAWDVLGLPSS